MGGGIPLLRRERLSDLIPTRTHAGGESQDSEHSLFLWRSSSTAAERDSTTKRPQ